MPEGPEKVLRKKFSILLILFIFGSFVRAWSDPVKSQKDAAVQVTAMTMGVNTVVIQKKAEPVKEPARWMKNSQDRLRDVGFLRTLEEKKRSLWVEMSDKVISSREFSENIWRNRSSSPLKAPEIKPSGFDFEKSSLNSYPDRNGSLEEGNILKTLKLLRSKEETFKQIFMGFRFSFDPTGGHLSLEVNVTPPAETQSGLMIRF
jgi:hypothetical protein